MTRVVLDTDFISSFLKIGRLALIQEYYRTEILPIPPAVCREVGWTQLSATLENLAWVREERPLLLPQGSAGPPGRGKGERHLTRASTAPISLVTADGIAGIP